MARAGARGGGMAAAAAYGIHGNHPVSPQCDFGGFHPHRYKCGLRFLLRKSFPLFFLSLFFNSYATSAKR
jgi:hypothetical protein